MNSKNHQLIGRIKEAILADFNVPESASIKRLTIALITSVIWAHIILDFFFEIQYAILETLLVFGVLNIALQWIAQINEDFPGLGTIQNILLYLIFQIHFIQDPSNYHIHVFWFPFLPILSLITLGIRWARIWLVVMAITVIFDGIYGHVVLGPNYTSDTNYISYLIGGLLFLAAIFLAFFMIYRLVGEAYSDARGAQKEVLELNQKLEELNSSLEQRVSDRTKMLEEKTELLKKIAFMNSHQVRSSLTKVLGATYIFASDPDKRDDMTEIIIDSATELDDVIKELGNTIAENKNGQLISREDLEKLEIRR